MGNINKIIEACATINPTIDKMLARNEENIIDLLDEQAELVRFNNDIVPRKNGDDISKAVRKILNEYCDEETVENICNSLKYRVINTANHMGGVFSPQSFQGDILFCALLQRLGCNVIAAPILASSTVPLTNSANLRYLVLFNENELPYKITLIPQRERMKISAHTEGLNSRRLKEVLKQLEIDFRKRQYISDNSYFDVKDFMANIYDEQIFEFTSYSEQIPLIENKISSLLFGNNPSFNYIDLEKLSIELLKTDIFDENSLLFMLISNNKLVKEANVKDESGTSLSSYLFKAIDGKKRIVPLKLTEDFELVGNSQNGEAFRFKATPTEIYSLIEEGTIFPAIAVCLLVTMFERGLTWMGGVFQSEYLPKFQNMIGGAFQRAGNHQVSDYIMRWKCNGYISGPIYLLTTNGRGLLNNAGPYECISSGVSWKQMLEIMENTSIRDSHIMGLFEFYNDLTTSNEKIEGWYNIISSFCGEHYRYNEIFGGINE